MFVAMGQGPILIGLGRALRCFKTVLGRAPMRVAVNRRVSSFFDLGKAPPCLKMIPGRAPKRHFPVPQETEVPGRRRVGVGESMIVRRRIPLHPLLLDPPSDPPCGPPSGPPF